MTSSQTSPIRYQDPLCTPFRKAGCLYGSNGVGDLRRILSFPRFSYPPCIIMVQVTTSRPRSVTMRDIKQRKEFSARRSGLCQSGGANIFSLQAADKFFMSVDLLFTADFDIKSKEEKLLVWISGPTQMPKYDVTLSAVSTLAVKNNSPAISSSRFVVDEFFLHRFTSCIPRQDALHYISFVNTTFFCTGLDLFPWIFITHGLGLNISIPLSIRDATCISQYQYFSKSKFMLTNPQVLSSS